MLRFVLCRVALILALFGAVLPVLFAQTKLVEGEQKFFETIDVRVMNVDAVVTGKDGKPVTGLSKDDFEVFENGVKQEITNFLEIRGTTAPSPASATQTAAAPAVSEPEFRRRLIAVFIDNVALEPFHRNAILPPLQRFLQANMRAGDQAMIAVWGSSLKLELPMTSDHAAVEAALTRLVSQTTRGTQNAAEKDQFRKALADLISVYGSLRPPEKPPYMSGLGEARSYAMRRDHELRQKEAALKSVIAALRGIEGRKICVLVTEKFSSNPSDDVFAYLDSIKSSFAGGDNASPMVDAREFERNSLVGEIGDAANGSGVTLYAIDGSGKETDEIDRSASVKVQVSSRSAPTTLTAGLTLRGVAAATGGAALSGSSNWQIAFDTIANDLNSYYSLGYRATSKRRDRTKAIQVRLRSKKYSVRTRQAVVEKSIVTEMNDAVGANLFYPVAKNDLKIEVTTGDPGSVVEGSMVVPVTVRIPTEALALLPEGSDLTGSFSVFAGFLRNDGAVSKIDRQVKQFRFPAESLKRRKEITVKLEVAADARTDAISIGVMDEQSHATGFAAVKVAAPPAATPPVPPTK
ncbi:MAG TPA: VWA domain-containing protein [Thermoanaerobaculia bacterium]|nr:VWA domain-containing protein [Thermoanaerobaculia bacterium]